MNQGNDGKLADRRGRTFGADIILALIISYVGYIGSFLSSVLTARLLGVEGRGVFSLFLETAVGITVFSSLGIGNGQIYETSRDPEKMKHFLPNGVIFSITMGGGASSIYFLAGYLSNFKNVRLLNANEIMCEIIVVPILAIYKLNSSHNGKTQPFISYWA